MKRLIVCCDGTWQNLLSEYPTNVVKLMQAVKPLAEDKTTQVVFYDEGVGTENRFERYIGGAFGIGIERNIREAYRFLCLNYESGDEIYLYGFSRGAYTVRSLAGLIYCSGLLYRHKIRHAPQAYQLYRQRTKPGTASTPNTEQAIQFRQANSRRVPIKFLGCWDTVGALGIPDLVPLVAIDEKINEKYQFHDTSLSPIIQNARHAVAIDEIRKVFDVTPMIKSTENPAQNLRQLWFPGDHGCVGGGTEAQSGLADGALKWMIDESRAMGLELDESRIVDGINLDSVIAFDNSPKGILVLSRRILRKVDFAHLHPSAIERWSKLDSYRPKNLAKYELQLNIKRKAYLAIQKNNGLPTAA